MLLYIELEIINMVYYKVDAIEISKLMYNGNNTVVAIIMVDWLVRSFSRVLYLFSIGSIL